ncbi:MAG: ornithine cyclodeaminase family protein [Rhizobiales bacterium]|nr:ornithine cyclodeaminase family protein [Hyphomicrobiales bacterium]
MTTLYSAADVEAALAYPRLVEALRDAFRAEGEPMPVRQSYDVGTPDAPGHLLSMPAWRRGEAIGTKLVTIFPANAALGLGSVSSLYVLFDGRTGAAQAILPGDELTNRRTGATSALASTYLSRPDSRTLLVVGNGHVAFHAAEAHCAVRPITQVLVYGRSAEKAAAFAEKLAVRLGPDRAVRAVADLATATAQADIIACGTTSKAPLILGAHVRPGTHVDLVGAFTPQMRESDDALVAKSAVYGDTRGGVLAEAGDLLFPIASGAWSADLFRGDLHDLCAGRVAGRTSDDEVTLFKSVGAAIEDLTAAMLVVEGA